MSVATLVIALTGLTGVFVIGFGGVALLFAPLPIAVMPLPALPFPTA